VKDGWKTNKYSEGRTIAATEIVGAAPALFLGRNGLSLRLLKNGAQLFIPFPGSLLVASEMEVPLAK